VPPFEEKRRKDCRKQFLIEQQLKKSTFFEKKIRFFGKNLMLQQQVDEKSRNGSKK
jgi:hypothetical protein